MIAMMAVFYSLLGVGGFFFSTSALTNMRNGKELLVLLGGDKGPTFTGIAAGHSSMLQLN
jgi:hypothetical protein